MKRPAAGIYPLEQMKVDARLGGLSSIFLTAAAGYGDEKRRRQSQ